jgi:hypothetical protein
MQGEQRLEVGRYLGRYVGPGKIHVQINATGRQAYGYRLIRTNFVLKCFKFVFRTFFNTKQEKKKKTEKYCIDGYNITYETLYAQSMFHAFACRGNLFFFF